MFFFSNFFLYKVTAAAVNLKLGEAGQRSVDAMSSSAVVKSCKEFFYRNLLLIQNLSSPYLCACMILSSGRNYCNIQIPRNKTKINKTSLAACNKFFFVENWCEHERPDGKICSDGGR